MIVLDFETNSHFPKDVLEVGAYKIVYEDRTYKVVDTFHRYYFSKYEINDFALAVHNLSPDRIKKLRSGKTYPEYFEDDKEFIDFCEGTETLIAHNVSFEVRYLDGIVDFKNHFCTMKENKNLVKALNIKGQLKNPKLIETCKFYKIKFNDSKYHTALYDAEKALEILNKMNNSDNNFNVIQYTVEKRKQKLEELKLKKEMKTQKKFDKLLSIEKKRLEREKLLENIECPKCASKHIHKKGKRQRKNFKVQRYQCVDCKTIFQEIIDDEIDSLSASVEIEKIAKENLLKKEKEKVRKEPQKSTITSTDALKNIGILKRILNFFIRK